MWQLHDSWQRHVSHQSQVRQRIADHLRLSRRGGFRGLSLSLSGGGDLGDVGADVGPQYLPPEEGGGVFRNTHLWTC